MKAHIVLRNSTDKQARAGTINAQRGPVRELATRCGATELTEYIEEGISGNTPLDERDVMLRLLKSVKPGELVCAFDLSRLTRAESMLQRYKVLGHLADAKVRIATVDDNGELDLESVGGRIQLHVKGEISSEERLKFRLRTTAGKVNAAKEGRKPQGATPYGWNFDLKKREWSLVEPQASIRRELILRIANGESTGKVADDLNRRRVPYPARKGRKGRPDSQPDWTAKRVWHFATQPINKGEWSFNGRSIRVPALVDAETFAQVQVSLSKNQERGRRRTQHIYMLDEGHGRCGLCGGALRIQWGNCGDGNDTPYYVCARRLNEKACELPWWRVDEADGLVWGECKKVLERPDLVEEALRSRAADNSVDGGLAEHDIVKGEARLKQIEEVRGIFRRQVAKGNMTEAELNDDLERLAREEKLVAQTVAAAREQAERARAVVADIGSVRAWLALVKGELDRADDAERRRICRALAPSVKVLEKVIRIGLKLRGPDSIALAGRTS